MATARSLIVNADDFGRSPGINRGIIKAHERGIVTSASLMVRWPASGEAAAYSGEHSALSLGLHVDLGEWAYRAGTWVPLYGVVPLDDAAAVAAEVARQLSVFRSLSGVSPTHIDSHQHVHQREPVRSILIKMGRKLGVPVRHYSRDVRYCGDFYGQTTEGAVVTDAISVAGLTRILATLPSGLVELGCHPSESDDAESICYSERAQEVDVLCHPLVRAAIAAMRIDLCSFKDRIRGLRATGLIKGAR